MEFAWHDYLGTFGVVIILVAYFLLQIGRINPLGFRYSLINLLGSAMIAISLTYQFNFSAFVIEICWMAISLIGIARAVRHRGATSDLNA